FMDQYNNQDPIWGKTLVQAHGDHFVVQTPPAMPLNQSDLDAVYALPYMGHYHPIYEEQGGVPAIEEVEFSLVSSRGCFGSCSFCALTFHQGRIIQSRSKESIVNEAKKMTWNPRFKGYIHDVGGPTANFRQPACGHQAKRGACAHKQCLFPEPCSQLVVDHADYLSLLRELRKMPGMKKVFVRSGVRYDYVLADASPQFLKELCEHHVSGQLKVAPEHISPKVLEKMGKPGRKVYDEFVRRYFKTSKEIGREQYLVPYFMSSHPGAGLKEAIELAEYIRDMGYNPEQVQDFIPTPGTLSTCMYYTGLDPRTMEKVHVPRDPHEKAMQRALLQYRNPKNYELVLEALRKAGREDLIGHGPKCLIRPRKPSQWDRSGESRSLRSEKGESTKGGRNAKGPKAVGAPSRGTKTANSDSRMSQRVGENDAKSQQNAKSQRGLGAKAKGTKAVANFEANVSQRDGRNDSKNQRKVKDPNRPSAGTKGTKNLGTKGNANSSSKRVKK
ncbi:MAG TPA: YgiQ family radical SAM protein, partial [Verrucomicrobiae bacterium]|nr:YgiQ family radical SAM protein [Verrucomicrobiae bacterium]